MEEDSLNVLIVDKKSKLSKEDFKRRHQNHYGLLLDIIFNLETNTFKLPYHPTILIVRWKYFSGRFTI